MESAILTKLGLKLAGPPRNEADVVYILVEIRKYLDHTDPEGNQYSVLRTYCDWPVHIILDRRGAKNLLRSLDDAFALSRTDAGRDSGVKAVFDRFSLSQFREELRLFLRSSKLPLDLVDDPAQWGQFLKHYVDVVSDCPFVYGKKPKRPKAGKEATPDHLNPIKSATLRINEATKSLEGQVEGSVNIVWTWELEFTDRTKKEFSNTYGYQLE
jgi:hypothetical protein